MILPILSALALCALPQPAALVQETASASTRDEPSRADRIKARRLARDARISFTALSERTEPSELVRLMNGYFERMSAAISAHRGYVSTFIGDGILAFFGATEPNPWQGNDAAEAALAMRAALADYNQELLARGLPELAIGIGLHRGHGVVGLVGSRELKEFAFVGRTVNVAARTQELTRTFATDIILTERLYRTIDPAFQVTPLPDTPVKGVDQPLAIYALDGARVTTP